MIRLLWLSDSPTCPTGLGTVSRHLLKRLHATGRYQILCRGWGLQAGSMDPQEFPYEIQPAAPDRSDGPALAEAIRSFQPDLLVTFGDLWNLDWLLRVPELNPARWIGYYPMDAGPVLPQFTPLLEATGTLVAPSHFSAGVLSAAVPHKPVEVIYHGVDTTCFRPLPHRQEGTVERCSMGEFVVGFVGRNQPRKQIPVLLRAFARFSRGREDAFLYLHTAARDCGWDLPALIEEYGLQEQSVISDRATALHGVSDPELNGIYNCVDVFVLPSTGEGFGLPILEAMAAGVPVVVTDSSAGRELATGRGELIRVASWNSAGPGAPEIAQPDEDHLLEILEKLYHDPTLRRRYSRQGREFAQTLAWDSLVEQWEKLFECVMVGADAPSPSVTRPANIKSKPSQNDALTGATPNKTAPAMRPLNYTLGIPYVNRIDLLRLTLKSVEQAREHIVVVDNSKAGDIYVQKLPLPYEVEVIRGAVPWTYSQSMSLLLRMASERGNDFLGFMHSDAEALPGGLERLLEVVDRNITQGDRWGICFTHYDILSALNLQAWREVGDWDVTLPMYFSDNDYYRRMELAGYSKVEAGGELIIHHNDGSNTIKADPYLDFLNGVVFPLYHQYYIQKWGGDPGSETFTRPFGRESF